MKEDFATWLDAELQQRGWSRSEAARRGKISASMLDKVITGYARPGLTFYQGVAKAFAMPLEEVMRRAGILPMPADATASDRRSVKEAMRQFERLPPDDQRRVSDLINRLLGEDE